MIQYSRPEFEAQTYACGTHLGAKSHIILPLLDIMENLGLRLHDPMSRAHSTRQHLPYLPKILTMHVYRYFFPPLIASLKYAYKDNLRVAISEN